MQIVLQSKQLLQALEATKPAVGDGKLIPITECVRILVEGKTMTFTTTDTLNQITFTIQTDQAADALMYVPHKLLLELLKNIGNTPLLLKHDAETNEMQITANKVNSYRIALNSNEDLWPVFDEDQSDSDVVIENVVSVKNALEQVNWSASKDELRPAMNCVYVELDMKFVAVSGRTFASRSVATANKLPWPILLFARSVKVWLATLPKEGQATLSVWENHAKIKVDNLSIVSRLCVEKYPDYKAIAAKVLPHKCVIDRQIWLLALKRAALFANKDKPDMALKIISPQYVQLSVENLNTAHQCHEELPMISSSEEMIEISFSVNDWIGALESFEENSLTFSYLNAQTPVLLENAVDYVLITAQADNSYYQ